MGTVFSMVKWVAHVRAHGGGLQMVSVWKCLRPRNCVCSLKQPTLIANLYTFQTGFFGDYTNRTIFPGLSTDRRHAFVAVVLQLKHCRRMRSPSFIFASSVKKTG